MTPLAYSMTTAVAATGLSKSHLNEAIHRGELRARKSSRNHDGAPQGKWVIRHEDLVAYIDSLPED